MRLRARRWLRVLAHVPDPWRGVPARQRAQRHELLCRPGAPPPDEDGLACRLTKIIVVNPQIDWKLSMRCSIEFESATLSRLALQGERFSGRYHRRKAGATSRFEAAMASQWPSAGARRDNAAATKAACATSSLRPSGPERSLSTLWTTPLAPSTFAMASAPYRGATTSLQNCHPKRGSHRRDTRDCMYL